MTHDPSTGRSSPPASFDFEITDFADARQVLDSLPAEVVKLSTLAPNYWDSHRRKPLPRDRALAGATIDWLLLLSQGLQPHALCESVPRVANALAAAWPDAAERAALLDGLLTDTRGKRKGFPARVRREIEALRSSLDADWPDTE